MPIYRRSDGTEPDSWPVIPVIELRLAARLHAALLRAGLLSLGDLSAWLRRSRRPFPGLDEADSARVLRAAGDRLQAWVDATRVRRAAALEAEVLAGVREAEAARGQDGLK